jgi:hypothetical protein
MSAVRWPAARHVGNGRFHRIGLCCKPQTPAQHHRQAQNGRQRVGNALARNVRRRAVNRFVQPNRARLPSAADGSIPSEPVIIEASSDKMSPNMLPVTTTSKSPDG